MGITWCAERANLSADVRRWQTGWYPKKNPAEAGFFNAQRESYSAGTMFEAWAPFGPWVTS